MSGRQMDVIRCNCGNVVGTRKGDMWLLAHQGRVIMCAMVFAFHCERCGQETVLRAPQAVSA